MHALVGFRSPKLVTGHSRREEGYLYSAFQIIKTSKQIVSNAIYTYPRTPPPDYLISNTPSESPWEILRAKGNP